MRRWKRKSKLIQYKVTQKNNTFCQHFINMTYLAFNLNFILTFSFIHLSRSSSNHSKQNTSFQKLIQALHIHPINLSLAPLFLSSILLYISFCYFSLTFSLTCFTLPTNFVILANMRFNLCSIILCLLFFIHFGHCDIFSSTSHLKNLMYLERHIITTLNGYLQKVDYKLSEVRK